MKIAYVVMYYPPHTGGLELVAQKQAESALQAGHSVSVVTFALTKKDLGTRDEHGVQVTRVRGIHFFDTYFGIPFCIGGIGMLRALQKAVRDTDVVHLHDVFYMTSWFAYLFAQLYRKPVVLTQHVAMVAHPSRIVTAIQSIVYRVFGTRICRGSQKIVVYNAIVKKFLMTEMGVRERNILEVRNGVAIERYKPVGREEKIRLREKFGLPTDRPLALFVGRFVPKKGYKELYEARDSSFDVVFVGSGTLPRAWYGEEGVHILGERAQAEMADIYAAADVFVSPSRGELFTLTMQEAFASGLPVITTNEKEYASAELDLQKIVLCEPTAVCLRKEIHKLIQDTSSMEAMGAYSRSLAEERFSWNANIEAVLALYKTLERQKNKAFVTTSWDDGHKLDLKVAELLKKYQMQGTFYIAPHNHELKEEDRLDTNEIKTLGKTFEIGAHTMTHRSLTELDDAEAQREIVESKVFLESILSKEVRSFCYPRGSYHKEHVAMVEGAGFTYARTVKRFATHADPASVFEARTSVHTYDHWSDVWGVLVLARFNLRIFFTLYRKWDRIATALFDQTLEQGGVFHLWGHSWELRDHDDWERFERVLQHISARDGVHYVSNRDVYAS